MKSDTIAAISTPPGEGAIGIIRLSGSDSLPLALSIFRAGLKNKKKEGGNTPGGGKDVGGDVVLRPRRLTYGHIVDAGEGIIDEVLICYHPAPHTYTREDIVEINTHGGMLLLKEILKLLLQKGARAAEPGEFTRRAYQNGRIDLLQAESILSIIEAKSLQALKASQRSLNGLLSAEVVALKESLYTVLAEIEVYLDFLHNDHDPEDETVSEQMILQNIKRLVHHMNQFEERSRKGRLWQHGLRVVITGRPNVGKSSLYNFMLGEERAIVTDIPGTTRDLLSEQISINGLSLRIIDTAGIHKDGRKDPVEKIGVSYSLKAIEEADLIIFMLDASDGITDKDLWIYNNYLNDIEKPLLFLANKTDLGDKIYEEEFSSVFTEEPLLKMSLVTKEGAQDIFRALEEKFYQAAAGSRGEENMIVLQIREEALISRAKGFLQNALRALEETTPLDLITIDLRLAEEALVELLGEEIREDLLDEIFGRFCIGK